MRDSRETRKIFATAAGAALLALVPALSGAAEPLSPRGTPPAPSFNQLHDFQELESLMEGYASAYPEWVDLESIGKSLQGRDIWLLTVTNPATGAPESKPAMYVDGNIHANEVQGAEATIYALDFLLKNYGRLERPTELLDRVTFYLIPSVNPDGRARWFEGPSTPNFPRTVMMPVDDDRDGLTDEDGYDDIDGNGVITRMRKKVPEGRGGFTLDPDDPRILEDLEPGELGDYVSLGWEGVDNDGDGRINEDPVGYVDPNRTWGYFWQPTYVQSGSGLYPFSIPETRSIALWALEHPNVAGVQSFHNYGQMILRGPGAKMQPSYPGADVQVYDFLAEQGEQMLPGYEYMITWEDLYTVYGDTTDYFYNVHGAVAFTNELYEAPLDLNDDGEVTEEEEMKFNDLLTGGRQFIDWHEVDHPQYGTVEVGGFSYDVGRVPESFLLEEDLHRNAMFVLFHARHLPKLRFGEPEVERVDRGLWAVTVPVINERATPTMLAVAKKNRVHRPDLATVEGAEVVASGVVENEWLEKIDLQEHRPERLEVSGVDGFSTRQLYFLLEGSGEATVTYDSLKGGTVTTTIGLR